MAYKDIKGIVVEIGGDTSGLQNALKKVNSATASLSKELRGINSMLKLDPKNTDLLAQKQTVLKNNIKETTKYLEELKKTQQEYIKSGGDLNSDKYRSLQREIILTENKLKQLKVEASNWTQTSKKLEELSGKMKNFGDAVSNVGSKVSILSAAMAGLFASGIKYNADIETTTKAFETFLGSAEAAQDAVNKIKEQSKSSPFDTKDLIKANQYLISAGINADDSRETINALADAIALTGGGNDELLRMAYNLQQVKGLGKATSVDIKQFGMAGIDIYGLLSKATGKTKEEIKDMDITYEDLSDSLIKSSKEGGKYFDGQATMADTLNGKISKLKKTFQELTGELSESLMPVIEKLTEKLQDVADWFKNLNPEQQQTITNIGLLLTAIGPVLLVLGKIISFGGTIFSGLSKITGAIGKATAGTEGLSGAMTAMTGPVGIVLGIIAALIASFVVLYNQNETFKESMQNIWNNIATVFNEVVKPAFNGVMGLIIELWENVIKPFGEFLWTFWTPKLVGIFTKIGGVFEVLFTQWGRIIENIMGALKGLLNFIIGVFTGDWGRAWEGITSMVKNIFGAVINYVKIPLNTIISLLNGAISGINQIKIPDWVPGLGGKSINIPLIPKLAKGGIVNRATLAMIGEGKSAEAVIPLDKTLTKYMAEALKMAGGNRNITLNFYPQEMTEAELERAFNYVDRRFGILY